MKIPHRIPHLVTAAIVAAALAAPAASARPDSRGPAGSEPVVIEPAPVVQSVDEGFDWASAALGAGAAGGLVLLIGVGGTGYRRRHEHLGVAG